MANALLPFIACTVGRTSDDAAVDIVDAHPRCPHCRGGERIHSRYLCNDLCGGLAGAMPGPHLPRRATSPLRASPCRIPVGAATLTQHAPFACLGFTGFHKRRASYQGRDENNCTWAVRLPKLIIKATRHANCGDHMHKRFKGVLRWRAGRLLTSMRVTSGFVCGEPGRHSTCCSVAVSLWLCSGTTRSS